MSRKNVLAVDFDAFNGGIILGNFDGNRIPTQETHHFPNDPVILNGTTYWDFLRLFFEMKQRPMKAKRHGKIDSVGANTRGVDLGPIGKGEYLLRDPVRYRGVWTTGVLERSFGKMDKSRFYQVMGSRFMEINAVFQPLALLEKQPGFLKGTSRFLLMPDSFNYYLCGAQVSGYPIASIMQMLDARTKIWSGGVLESLGVSERLLSGIVPCGTRLDFIKTGIYQELGIEPMEVIAVAGHDTQSALVAAPTRDKDFISISCGTRSLFGTELDEPVINGLLERLNITNESGCQGKVPFLKNIIELRLIQESRRQWIREGREYGLEYLEQMAVDAKPFKTLIDPDTPEFVPAGNIPERVWRYYRGSGQRVPENEAETVRCIDENLASKYRMTLEETKMCTERKYPAIRMVGGETQSGPLCRMTANTCHCPVIAGSVGATVLGGVVVQLPAAGELRDLDQVRGVAGASAKVSIYESKDTDQWGQVYGQYKEMLE